ncbi:MAG: hypothetical protein WBQ21_14400 [Solirubrobacteraceae bacterium]
MSGSFFAAPTALAVVSLALVCCGCESTQEKSAALGKAAKHERLALEGVSVSRESPSVRVLSTAVVHSSEATAVTVTLLNTSSKVLENAPIEITVRDAKGAVLFRNDQPGEAPSLAKVSLLGVDAQTMWIDDQVQVSGVPASASALVGEATPASGPIPQIGVSGVHAGGEASAGAGAAGTVSNRSSVTQQSLVVNAIARRGAKIVAAGRAILPEVASGASLPFQVYFVGNASGAKIETSAPPTTF